MPTYAMKCDCGHSYEEFRFFSEGIPPECPKCKEPLGERFNQDWMRNRPAGWTYGEDRITTVGQLGEHNYKRAGKEKMQKMMEEVRESKSHWKGPTIEGAVKPEKVDPKDVPVPWYKDSHDVLNLDKIPDVQRYIETGQ